MKCHHRLKQVRIVTYLDNLLSTAKRDDRPILVKSRNLYIGIRRRFRWVVAGKVQVGPKVTDSPTRAMSVQALESRACVSIRESLKISFRCVDGIYLN